MPKYILVMCVFAIAWVAQPKFSDWVASKIDAAKKEIILREIEISGLKREINFAQNSMNIEVYAKSQGWDLVNLQNDQIVLTWNEKSNKYEIQNEKPNLLEQIFLSFRE